MVKQFVSTLAVATVICGPSPVGAQAPIVVAGVERIASGALTGAVIDELFGRIQALIDDATQKGDYLMVRAGIEARIALENFKLINLELLDKAFSSLDQASRDNFARINSTVQEAKAGALEATAAVQQIADSAQQLAVIADPHSYRSFLIRFNPTVISPSRNAPVRMSVRGVNLDESTPVIVGKLNTYTPKTITKQELVFEVPAAEFESLVDRISLSTLQFRYSSIKPGWWSRTTGTKEVVTRPISFASLPQQVGKYSFATSVASTNRVTERKQYALEQFKGVNADQPRAIAPPPGWKIDLGSLSHTQGEGEGRSRCSGFSAENRSEFGVVFKAHVGRIKNARNPNGAPGYVNCSVAYTLYKDEPTEVPGPSGTGDLTWASDVLIPMPANLKSFTLTMFQYDGTKQIQTNDASTKFYSLTKEPGRLIIRPKVPSDIGN